jgi:MerR family transcriptional regulator, thiopeptide resistance regulator
VNDVAWTIGETARLAKVSVRTLHHYDQLGILTPSARTDAGYRLYEPGDIERLHRVMVFRELGFSLDEIGRIVTDPDFDRTEALRAQRALLAEKARRTEAMLTAIDAALAAAEGGTAMSDQEHTEMFGELFDGFDPAEYEDEVQERWGDTDAYKQSAARTKRYTKADWEQIKAEGDANTAEFIRLLDAGVAPAAPEALAAAAEKHAQLEKWFYDAPPEMFGNLADMWVNDQRFKKNIDKPRAGLAEYERAAVKAWVATQTG